MTSHSLFECCQKLCVSMQRKTRPLSTSSSSSVGDTKCFSEVDEGLFPAWCNRSWEWKEITCVWVLLRFMNPHLLAQVPVDSIEIHINNDVLDVSIWNSPHSSHGMIHGRFFFSMRNSRGSSDGRWEDQQLQQPFLSESWKWRSTPVTVFWRWCRRLIDVNFSVGFL